MATGEDQAQAIVLDRFPLVVAGRGIGDFRDHPGMVVDAGVAGVAAQPVDGLEAAGGDEPGNRVGGHTVARPLFGGCDERVMFGFLGAFEAAEQADEGREDASPVAAVDRLERGDARAAQFAFAHAKASSCSARASGVRASAKSSMPYTGRISMSDSVNIGFGQRRTHSMASSSEPTFQIQ